MRNLERDLPFRVELWDAKGNRLEEVLSASVDLRLGKAAFREAVKRRAGQHIVLRHKARVIAET